MGEQEGTEDEVVHEWEKMEEDAPTFTLITDGSQFRIPFWDAEVQSLQDRIRRQLVGLKMDEIPSRRTPTSEELQMQFVQWLLEQPHLPLLVSPESSGFYDAVYGRQPKPDGGTGFFDDEYVSGKRKSSVPTVSQDGLNPANRPELIYKEAWLHRGTHHPRIDRAPRKAPLPARLHPYIHSEQHQHHVARVRSRPTHGRLPGERHSPPNPLLNRACTAVYCQYSSSTVTF
jgi:hypothetical protein